MFRTSSRSLAYTARTRGTIHSRVLNRRKMLLDFLEFMNELYGQGCLKTMQLADLTMDDVEAYNKKIALAGYSQSQVSERMQMIHALIERAGRPEFGHQMLGWNWDSRDVTHGKPTKEMRLLTLPRCLRHLPWLGTNIVVQDDPSCSHRASFPLTGKWRIGCPFQLLSHDRGGYLERLEQEQYVFKTASKALVTVEAD